VIKRCICKAGCYNQDIAGQPGHHWRVQHIELVLPTCRSPQAYFTHSLNLALCISQSYWDGVYSKVPRCQWCLKVVCSSCQCAGVRGIWGNVRAGRGKRDLGNQDRVAAAYVKNVKECLWECVWHQYACVCVLCVCECLFNLSGTSGTVSFDNSQWNCRAPNSKQQKSHNENFANIQVLYTILKINFL
jgi:hypothetical protein